MLKGSAILLSITVRSTHLKIKRLKSTKGQCSIFVPTCFTPKMSIWTTQSPWNIMSSKLKIGSGSMKINKVNSSLSASRIKYDNRELNDFFIRIFSKGSLFEIDKFK